MKGESDYLTEEEIVLGYIRYNREHNPLKYPPRKVQIKKEMFACFLLLFVIACSMGGFWIINHYRWLGPFLGLIIGFMGSGYLVIIFLKYKSKTAKEMEKVQNDRIKWVVDRTGISIGVIENHESSIKRMGWEKFKNLTLERIEKEKITIERMYEFLKLHKIPNVSEELLKEQIPWVEEMVKVHGESWTKSSEFSVKLQSNLLIAEYKSNGETVL